MSTIATRITYNPSFFNEPKQKATSLRLASLLHRKPSSQNSFFHYKQERCAVSDGNDFEDSTCPVTCVEEIFTREELDHAIEKTVGTETLVVVDFYRPSCGSCKYIETGFIKLCKGEGAAEHEVIFLKHNVLNEYDEQSDLADDLRIKVVPLFHFYKHGKLVEKFPTRDKGKLSAAIEKYLSPEVSPETA